MAASAGHGMRRGAWRVFRFAYRTPRALADHARNGHLDRDDYGGLFLLARLNASRKTVAGAALFLPWMACVIGASLLLLPGIGSCADLSDRGGVFARTSIGAHLPIAVIQ